MAHAVKLAYLKFVPEVAAPSSHPLAILHGVLGSKMNWRSIGKKLSDRLERTVIFVFRVSLMLTLDFDHWLSYESICLHFKLFSLNIQFVLY